MTKDEMIALNRGDLIKGKLSKGTYVVTSNYGSRITAVDSVDVTNPEEWELVELYCHQCSAAGGADTPVFHKPPICRIRK